MHEMCTDVHVELLARCCRSVVSVGEVLGELLSPVGGLLPPGGQPVGSERLGTWRRLRAVALGEVASLG